MAWGQWGLFAAPRGWGLFAVGGGVAVTFADMSTEGLGARGRRRRGRRARAQRRRGHGAVMARSAGGSMAAGGPAGG